MSTHGTIVCLSLLLLLLQVEEPDPANHTDTRNPATHAEKKGVYILLVGFWIFGEELLLLRHFSQSFCSQDTTEPMETHFLLADNVYCKASVPPTDKVCLWLGVSPRPTMFTSCCSISVHSEVCLWVHSFD